jgi:hypothetical protein
MLPKGRTDGNHIRKPESEISRMIPSETGSGYRNTMGFMKFLDIRHKFLNQKLYISFVISDPLLWGDLFIIKTPGVNGLNIIKLYFSLFYKPVDASVKVKVMILGILSLRGWKHDDRMPVMSGLPL